MTVFKPFMIMSELFLIIIVNVPTYRDLLKNKNRHILVTILTHIILLSKYYLVALLVLILLIMTTILGK